MPGNDIIVIGTSAGGVEALPTAVANLPKNLPASVFIVLHLPSDCQSKLPEILMRSGSWPAVHPKDKEKIERGKIYVAPPDFHLWLENGHVRVTHGPRINRHRPAIDPLFETAAHTYGPRVTGVVLTGSLDDGAAGLYSIKKCGGVAVVQDPEDAMVRGMPEAALRVVKADYCLPLEKISPVLIRLARRHLKSLKITCKEKMNFKMEAPNMNPQEMNKKIGPPSGYICPECSGPLWQIHDGKLVKFRCLVGHSFSPQSLLAEEAIALERALWVAVKTLEEHSTLLRGLAEQVSSSKNNGFGQNFDAKANETEREANSIREIIKKMC